MYSKQKNSHIPTCVMPIYLSTSSGTNGSILKPISLSNTAKNTTDIIIAIFLIAPSMPKQLLNFFSLIALSNPKTVSNITAINTVLTNRLHANVTQNILIVSQMFIYLSSSRITTSSPPCLNVNSSLTSPLSYSPTSIIFKALVTLQTPQYPFCILPLKTKTEPKSSL